MNEQRIITSRVRRISLGIIIIHFFYFLQGKSHDTTNAVTKGFISSMMAAVACKEATSHALHSASWTPLSPILFTRPCTPVTNTNNKIALCAACQRILHFHLFPILSGQTRIAFFFPLTHFVYSIENSHFFLFREREKDRERDLH